MPAIPPASPPPTDSARCRMLELVAQHTSSMVVVTDRDGRIRWVNPAYTAVTGWTLDEVRGRSPASFLHGPLTCRRAKARLRAMLRSGQRVKAFEILNYKKSGQTYWVSLNIEPVFGPDGAISDYVAIQEDITERRAAETLAREKALLAQAARAQMDALSRISHELRTPLHAVVGFAELIERRDASALSERSRGHLQQIRRSAGHLMLMVDDILELARLHDGRAALVLEPVALAPLAQEVLSMLEPLAELHGVALELGIEAPAPCARADRKRLSQVLINLAGNAIKYNRRGGHVRLRLQATPDGRDVLVSVTDDGAGISAQDLAHLFEPFYRVARSPAAAPPGAPEVPGSGLGLPIAKSLVEGMGGALRVHSVPGAGSTFTVQLPAAAAAPAAVPDLPPPNPDAGGEPACVLYIEDNEVNRGIVAAYLAARPQVRLVCRDTVHGGIEAARTLQPDLILCDMRLPDGSGLDVLRAVLDEPAIARTPCVAFSPDADASAVDAAIRSGFRHYLPKPVDARTFLCTIDALLAGRGGGAANGTGAG